MWTYQIHCTREANECREILNAFRWTAVVLARTGVSALYAKEGDHAELCVLAEFTRQVKGEK